MTDEQLMTLAEEYQTPMHIFDMDVLKKRVAFLKNHLPARVSLCYAVKANTFIIKELCGQVERFEVCSPGELAICRRLHVPMEQVVLSGVYKTPAVMEMLFREGVPIGVFTAESMEQYLLLSELAEKYSMKIKLLLRLTSGNQFGMDESVLIQVIHLSRENTWVEVEGIQFFSGTQKTSIKKLKRELTYVDTFIQRLEAEEDFQVKELEFGPGLPVSYFQGEDFDEIAFLAEFSELLGEMTNRVKLTFELGRSIAASCGTYMTSIVDAKVNKKQNYAIVDGGIHQLVYYGQSMAMKHPYCHVLPEKKEGETVEWNLFGSLCTVNDILVKQMPIRNLRVGDVVVFEKTGAYSTTEGIALFLSRDLPKILLRGEDGTIQILRDAVDTDPLNTPSYNG